MPRADKQNSFTQLNTTFRNGISVAVFLAVFTVKLPQARHLVLKKNDGVYNRLA
jgi:hypothetical protein